MITQQNDNSGPLIRKGVLKDVEKITCFNALMALETEQIVLDKERLKRGVKAVLTGDEQAFYLVAEIKNEVRACLMVTTEWSDWRNSTFWWIQSVYVQKEYRKQGIYASMYASLVKKIEKKNKIAGIRLYVEKENTGAQKVYKKLGMHETRYLMFEDSIAKQT